MKVLHVFVLIICTNTFITCQKTKFRPKTKDATTSVPRQLDNKDWQVKTLKGPFYEEEEIAELKQALAQLNNEDKGPNITVIEIPENVTCNRRKMEDLEKTRRQTPDVNYITLDPAPVNKDDIIDSYCRFLTQDSNNSGRRANSDDDDDDDDDDDNEENGRDFDGSTCPNSVEVINLVVEDVKIYDKECEINLSWRSLN
ncbi:hypothetical protein JYU34_009828 [Plutella xylostella]|uniref:Uncharacterized protein n=1 Tax=Plutella xylostella TaxID=51655 RepID=A0ABQ7QKE9_PLUXY|nr:hypothetical protein JYU34_009828 [Plutella xylostella]